MKPKAARSRQDFRLFPHSHAAKDAGTSGQCDRAEYLGRPYRQFQQQYDVIRNMGISTGRIVLNGWPHGFGSDGGWVNDYAAWLESVFANKEEF